MYQELLDEFVVFMLDISIWTGRKTLHAEDLADGGIDISALPPETLASLGSKRIISKEALSPFSALKREAEKNCLAVGTRFLGGYAVPASAAKELRETLDSLQEQFVTERSSFCLSYDQAVEDWINENPPQWHTVIRSSVESVSSVSKALNFSYTPIAISAPEGLNSDTFETQINSLLGQVCSEVRQSARAAYRASFHNKAQVTRKALRPIHAIRKKLDGLAFLDPLIPSTIEAIDLALATVPDKGPIEGTTLNLLAGLLGGQLANLGQASPDSDQNESDIDEEDHFSTPQATPQTYPTVHGTSALKWDF